MKGAAMLKRHQFVRSLWALYRLVVSSITFVRHLYVGESGAALVLMKEPTFSTKDAAILGNMPNNR